MGTQVFDDGSTLTVADSGAVTSTNATDIGANVLSSTGLASSLTAVVDTVTGAVKGTISFVNSLFTVQSGVKLPLPNPLFAYASYDYIFSLYALTDAELHNPDTTYMIKPPKNLIFSSAHINPNNRPKTAFGAFEFYIDDVEIVSQIGMDKSAKTNVYSITFKVTEPYSMGTFLLALQQAAQNAGSANYLQAAYLLTIDFRGTTETGAMSTPPKTAKRIPIRFRNTSMTITESGTVYTCDTYPWNIGANDVQHSQIPKDVAIKGKTVQEILQTGEKSLQNVINQAKANEKSNSKVAVPDQILILFPVDPSSAGTSGTTGASATASIASTDLATKLGVKQVIPPNSKNAILVQDAATVNEFGKASLGLSDSRKGDASFPSDNKAASKDPSKGVIRANNFIDPTTGDFRFSQETDITTAINEVLLNSDYIKTALTAGVVDTKGQRKWWRIDVQHYNISTSANDKYTGVKPKLTVYRVIPYTVHTSSGPMPPNTKSPGLSNLAKDCVKVYNYIYTGKNADIIKFNIEFKMSFLTTLGQAGLNASQDVKTVIDESGAKTEKDAPNIGGLGLGNAPPPVGQIPTGTKNTKLANSTDGKGGGGREDQATRSARLFHDAISMQSEMTKLEMEIIGDPYYIVQSGTGNYTAKSTEHQNLSADGGMNYQNGEVHILVNFRTPVDLNQNTGLYNFGTATTAPNLMWSGLYRVVTVTSKFKGGEFRQTISGVRLPLQEAKTQATAARTFNIQQPPPNTGNSVPGQAAVTPQTSPAPDFSAKR
jgi:hypothetical protein